MDTKEIIIEISEPHSAYIEKLWFEYNAMCNILEYLSNNGGNKEYFAEYFEEAREKYIELELAKKEVLKFYNLNFEETMFYKFDFENNTIIFSDKEI